MRLNPYQPRVQSMAVYRAGAADNHHPPEVQAANFLKEVDDIIKRFEQRYSGTPGAVDEFRVAFARSKYLAQKVVEGSHRGDDVNP